jgi:hypothetical protein
MRYLLISPNITLRDVQLTARISADTDVMPILKTPHAPSVSLKHVLPFQLLFISITVSYCDHASLKAQCCCPLLTSAVQCIPWFLGLLAQGNHQRYFPSSIITTLDAVFSIFFVETVGLSVLFALLRAARSHALIHSLPL